MKLIFKKLLHITAVVWLALTCMCVLPSNSWAANVTLTQGDDCFAEYGDLSDDFEGRWNIRVSGGYRDEPLCTQNLIAKKPQFSHPYTFSDECEIKETGGPIYGMSNGRTLRLKPDNNPTNDPPVMHRCRT